jgi:hypothetical protein
MSDQELENRYRRWLAFYPRSYRAEHEDEMLAVLLQTARPDQSHPSPVDAADLALHGVRTRASHAGRRAPGNWERAHANVMVPVRIAIAIWLTFISAMLIGFHRGEVWLVLLIPAIALHLCLAYRARRARTRT